MSQQQDSAHIGQPSPQTAHAALQAENDALRRSNRALAERLEWLERRVDALAATVSAPSPAAGAGTTQAIPDESGVDRRGLFARASVGVVAACTGFVLGRPALAHADSGTGLVQYMQFSTPGVTNPPLDSAVVWSRRDPVGVGAGYTNQIVSLISDNSQANSFAWPLYIELRATTSAAATQVTSQSTGAYVRAYNSSAGSPWMTAFHSEPIHGMDAFGREGAVSGTTIGYNMELTRKSRGGTAIGLLVMNTPGSSANGDHAISIASAGGDRGWSNGIHFGGPDDEVSGNVAINITARYNRGLSLGPNDMGLSSGRRIFLETFGTAWLWYNPSTGNIELYKGNTLVGSW